MGGVPGAREDGGTGMGLRAGAAGGCGGGSGIFVISSATVDSSLPISLDPEQLQQITGSLTTLRETVEQLAAGQDQMTNQVPAPLSQLPACLHRRKIAKPKWLQHQLRQRQGSG